MTGYRVSRIVGFGGDTKENLVFINRKDGHTDVALDYEFFAHTQRMVLHGCPPCGPDDLARWWIGTSWIDSFRPLNRR
jgi:hypothetical protein